MHLKRLASIAAIAFGVALLGQASCQSAPCENPSCPATYEDISLGITAPDGGTVNDVQATLSGFGVYVTLTCATAKTGEYTPPIATTCTWPEGGQCADAGTSCMWVPPAPGSYALRLTAPGFETASVSATIANNPAPACGCGSTTLQPATVTLQPM